MTDSFENPPSGDFHLAQVDEPTNYGRLALRVGIALVISSLIVFIWVRFGHKTPVATGDIARIAIYPVQARISRGAAGTPGEQGQDEIINQLLVFTHVRLHNPNKAPITIEDVQKQLRPNEALLLFTTTARFTFVWTVTPSASLRDRISSVVKSPT